MHACARYLGSSCMRVRFELYSAHLPGTETVNIYNFFVKYFLFDVMDTATGGVKYSGVYIGAVRIYSDSSPWIPKCI